MKHWYAELSPAFKGLVTGSLIGLLVAVWTVSPFGVWLERTLGLYALFHWRDSTSPPEDVVIVTIDKASTDTLDLPAHPRAWSRAVHGELVDRLTEAGARLVVFDLLFSQPRDDKGDRRFAASLKQANNVLLVEEIEKEVVGLEDASLSVERLVPPVEPIRGAALAQAPFPLPVRPVRVNDFWTFKPELADAPTIPVLGLFLYYRDQLPALTRLLAEAGIHSKATDIRTWLSEIRETGRRHPKRVQQVQYTLRQDEQAGGSDTSDLKAMVDTLFGPARRYINFYGPPRTVQTIPYAAVVSGLGQWDAQQLAQTVRGKMVFVGFAERRQPQQRDHFYTVFSQDDGLDISGVEIAATAVGNLMDGNAVQAWSGLAVFVFVILMGALLGLLISTVNAAMALTGVAFAAGAYVIIAQQLFNHGAIWSPLVHPLLVLIPIGLISGYVSRFVASNRERERVRKAFGYFIPNDVVKELAKAGEVKAGGKQVHGVCLATDAAQYTQLAENMDPKALSDIMNDYYAQLFKPVKEYGGFVSDVVGDAMLALWVSARREDALNSLACQACMDIGRGVASFNRMHSQTPLPTRIGIHCGDVVLGHIGAEDHFEYRAVGDIVNTANRIQGLNKYLGTDSLVSGDIAAAAPEFMYRDLGDFVLAGRKTSVQILELLGPFYALDEEEKIKADRFAEALALFYDQQWTNAENAFQAFLQRYPKDGPATFYYKQCRRYQQDSESWQGAVAMQSK